MSTTTTNTLSPMSSTVVPDHNASFAFPQTVTTVDRSLQENSQWLQSDPAVPKQSNLKLADTTPAKLPETTTTTAAAAAAELRPSKHTIPPQLQASPIALHPLKSTSSHIAIDYKSSLEAQEQGKEMPMSIALSGLLCTLQSASVLNISVFPHMPEFLKARMSLFVSLVTSKNRTKIAQAWSMLTSAFQVTSNRLAFIEFQKRTGFGLPGTNTYQEAFTRMASTALKKITKTPVEGSTTLFIYTVEGKTTNNKTTAKWMSTLLSPFPPMMIQEFLAYRREHNELLLTYPDHEKFERNANRETKIITVKEQQRQQKER